MSNRLGLFYGFAAYLWWGSFPLFFMLLAAVDPFEVVPWRVLTALAFCVVAVTVLRTWAQVFAVLRSPRVLGWFALSTVLLYINWQVFVYSVVTGRILETALGYFINPLITILIGVIVRREHLTRMQWVSVSIAALGVLIGTITYGTLPLFALMIAVSFGCYGAVRKHVSDRIDALTGLTIETGLGSVLAAAQLGVIALLGGLGAFTHGVAVTTPLLLSGVMTAIPLLLFAASTRLLPLAHMGFLQFFTPILSFLTGYSLFHEPMPPARWIGFVAVWLALIVLVWDMLAMARRNRTPQLVAPAPSTGELPVQPGP